MSAEVFLLFCLCYFVSVCVCTSKHRCGTHSSVRDGEMHVFVCVSQNVCLFESCAASLLAEEYVKSPFLLKFLQQRHCGSSSLTASRESVQVTGTNTISHLVREHAFELTAYVAWLSVRLTGAGHMCWRVGWDSPWEEVDDTINYISKKPAECVKMRFCEWYTWIKAAERRRVAVSTLDSRVWWAPWTAPCSLHCDFSSDHWDLSDFWAVSLSGLTERTFNIGKEDRVEWWYKVNIKQQKENFQLYFWFFRC